MTVADMVGNHGHVWGSYAPPTTTSAAAATALFPGTDTDTSQSYAVQTASTVMSTTTATTALQVIAGTDLPRAASTRSHKVHDLRLVLTQDKFQSQQIFSHAATLNLKIVGGELLAGDDLQLSAWLPLLPLASDVHTESATLTYDQNLTSESSGHGSHFKGTRALRLTLTRTLKAGEGLSLWFSSEVAAHLGLPFLNFSHIRDGAYVCPKCNHQYSAPNPLKLHLATRCDTLPSHVLWDRLFTAPSQPDSPPWYTPFVPSSSVNNFPIRLRSSSEKNPFAMPRSITSATPCVAESSSSPKTNKHVSPDSTSSPISSPELNSSLAALHEPKSAFRRVSSHLNRKQELSTPIRFQALQHHSNLIAPGPSHGFSRPPVTRPFLSGLRTTTSISEALISPHILLGSLLPCPAHPSGNAQTIMPVMPLTGGVRPLLTTSATPPTVDPCAEMETLVSNLGRSRRGHLCLYCGKIYSRKYGLKIHIRTHTGYKPLKCKVCLRPFGDPSNLNKHVRLHAEGETPYRCDHCGKVLVRRRDLDRHLRSRHPELPILNISSLTDTDEEGDQEGDCDGDDGNEEEGSEIVEVGDNVDALVSTTYNNP